MICVVPIRVLSGQIVEFLLVNVPICDMVSSKNSCKKKIIFEGGGSFDARCSGKQNAGGRQVMQM